MFKHVKIGNQIEYMGQTLSKNMLIVNFYPGMKCLHALFSFISTCFLTGTSSFRDEISSRQKCVNSKRHFIIEKDDFIPGWNSTRKHSLNVFITNELLFVISNEWDTIIWQYNLRRASSRNKFIKPLTNVLNASGTKTFGTQYSFRTLANACLKTL